MRKGLLAVIAAAMMAGLGGASLALPNAPSLPASSALENYLATGILPADVSGEPGVWNFAGPAGTCPGPGWNCETLGLLPVTQIGTVNVIQCVGAGCVGSTQTGYANTYECNEATAPPGPPAPPQPANGQVCDFSQTGDYNQARCVLKKRPGTTTVPPAPPASFWRQLCEGTQTGGENQATVVQLIEQTGPPVQGALQEVVVKQTGSKNQLQSDQEIKQFSDGPGDKDQDAYQVVIGPDPVSVVPVPGGTAVDMFPATQTTAVAGVNQAQINQKQHQRAIGGEEQTQNDGAFGSGAPADFQEVPDDCHDSPVSPAYPNLCANAEQTSGGGHNQLELNQTWDAEASTTVTGSDQQQGVAPFTGGYDGRIHQVTTPAGSNQSQANQEEILKLSTTGSDQTQYGGGGCCGFGSQIGPGTEMIDESKIMKAEGGTLIDQTATLVGTSSSPTGNCGIDHDVQTKGDQASESASSEPCIALAVITTCENDFVGEEEEEVVGACQQSDVEACAPGEEPNVDVEGSDVSVNCEEPFIGPS